MKEFDIKILVSLKKTLNITKTANELFTTQPNITKHIQTLEEKYHLPLLIRKKNGIAFTPAGECLAHYAQEMQRLSLQMQADLNTFRNDQKLSLTIGTPHSFSRFSLPDILSDFYKTVSNVELHIETAHSSQLIPLLEAETLDVAFIRGDIPFQGEKYLFSKDQVYLVSASPIDMKKLPTLPQIFYKKDSYSNQLIESWWHSMYDQAPNYILTVSDAETCHDMVSKGLGYGIFLLSQYIRGPHLHYEPLRFPDGSPLYRNTWICFSNTPSLAKDTFQEFILKRIQMK